MSPDGSLDFFAEQLARAARGLEIAQSSRNAQLAAVNLRQLFKGHLMRGLIKWRERNSPLSEFDAALRLTTEATSILNTVNPSITVEAQLPTGPAELLSALLTRGGGATRAVTTLPPDVSLDLLLARADPSLPTPSEAKVLVEELRKAKRTALAAETYDNYFRILASRGNDDALFALVRKGETLFGKRARDGFYSSGDQTEGGGPDNAVVVDYRLGLVMKKVGYRSDSMHSWAW